MDGRPWWESAVVYQVYPRSFADASGDGVGDLPGITSRLEYLRWLGVDAVWISPFYPSPMKDFGYDVSDYTDVHPMFGTLSDFDGLLEEAHRRDHAVLTSEHVCVAFAQVEWATFQDDPVGPATYKIFGENNYMWASDFPHTDSTWPESRQWIAKDFAGVPEEVTRKIVFENAVKLYRMDLN